MADAVLSPFETLRRKLQNQLEELLGSSNVYYNAPSGMRYPCIRYKLEGSRPIYADNRIYKMRYTFELTCIGIDITSDLFERIMKYFVSCEFVSSYTAENLPHTKLRLSLNTKLK